MLSTIRKQKSLKKEQKSLEVVVEVATKDPDDEKRILRCLIDSGSSGCIILNEFTKGLQKEKSKSAKWTTKGGTFSTSAECAVPFYICDFSTQKRVQWTFHVDCTEKSSNLGYDMIIGRDLLSELGIDIMFSTGTLRWEDTKIPMCTFGELQNRENAHHCYYIRDDVDATNELTKRTVKILDSKYDKIDVSAVVDKQEQLNATQKQQLHKLLTKHENTFNGELGDWKSSPVSIELQKDAKPFHAKAYPVPQIHEAAMRREVERLVAIGVLEEANDSEWAAPMFIIPKKDG
jgi:hypothetical protein